MKYKMIRVPIEVWEDWFNKKKKIQERVKFVTKKNSKISMIGVLKFYGKRQGYIFDDEVVNFFKEGKRNKIFSGELL
jgi:hypothetical protein